VKGWVFEPKGRMNGGDKGGNVFYILYYTILYYIILYLK
jgi:hypothetical protein